MRKEILRFKRCDDRFYPYIESALDRMPEEVKEALLNDEGFEILSSDDFNTAHGLYYNFDKQITNIVYLNTRHLSSPKKMIVHTIAHEFAHYSIGGGDSMLFEKEAEELLVKWGFGEDVNQIKYHLPIIESKGYEIGYEWAKKKGEKYLSIFFQYYEEWDNEQLSGERLEHLIYDLDPGSVLNEMVEHEDEILKDEGLLMASLVPDGTFFRSVAWGVMGAVKEIIQMRRNDSYRYSEEKRKIYLIELLQRIDSDMLKLFDLESFEECSSLTNDQNISYEDIIRYFSIEVGELLAKLES